jgi:HlyD family secretion protein
MDNKKMVKIAVAALIVVGAIFYVGKKSNIFKTTEVKVVSIEKGQLADSNTYTGVVAPGKIEPIYVDTSGIVENIFVREGENIEAGAELMSFSNQSIIENQKALRVNELDIQDIELQIQDQESGSLKLELDNRLLEIRGLEEQINADAKKLPTLEKEARVFEKLLKEDGVSAVEARKKEQAYEDLKVALDLNREKYNLMVVGYESLKRELNIEETKLRSQLEKLKLTNEALKAANKQLTAPFTSPVSGIVVNIAAKIGEGVAPGQRVVSIAIPGESRVTLELPTYQVDSVKKGDTAYVISREGDGKRYKAIVEKASVSAVSSNYGSNKVIAVEVLVTEPNSLRPGFVADVELSTKPKKDVLMINSFSVIEESGNYYVYVVENGKAKKQKVNIGFKSSNNYEVLDLAEGTEVIVNPFKVKEGVKVKVVD